MLQTTGQTAPLSASKTAVLRHIVQFFFKTCPVKVTGTHVYLEITITRFMQPMPIHTPLSTKLLLGSNPFRPTCIHILQYYRGEATRMPWPLPHKMLNSEPIPQTFFAARRIAPSASDQHADRCEYQVQAGKINKFFTAHLPRAGTLEKWHPMKV